MNISTRQVQELLAHFRSLYMHAELFSGQAQASCYLYNSLEIALQLAHEDEKLLELDIATLMHKITLLLMHQDTGMTLQSNGTQLGMTLLSKRTQLGHLSEDEYSVYQHFLECLSIHAIDEPEAPAIAL